MLTTHSTDKVGGFSLVEVVVALGVISFALLAIFGVLPIGLNTGHSAQNETRAPQIAQDILSSLASQARDPTSPDALNPKATIQQPGGASYDVDLTGATSSYTLSANNDGNLVATYSAALPYKVTITIDPKPAGFDVGRASQVTVAVAWPAAAKGPNQTTRDFTRIITTY